LDDSSLILSRGQKFFSSTPCPDWLWGIPSLLSKGYWSINGLGEKLTIHFHAVLMLRMCGAIPPLPSMSS